MTTAGAITVHFVRHGETAGNAERRFQMPETPLSEVGLAQAAAVADTLAASTSPTVLLASDYTRARQTAEIIGGRLKLGVQDEPALRERNFGIARGRLYSEVGEETMAVWRDPHVRIEQGESWADVYERVGRFLDALRAGPPAREMVLVTHGGSMNIALWYLAGKTIDAFELAPLENCALRTVVIENGQ